MSVNLKLLHSFLLVAEHGSFRQAAEQSHRSLPAISMQIRRLEEQLGVSLFHRTTRRVQLTAEGQQLLAYARRALAEMETGLRQIRQAVEMQQGRLSVACVPTLAATLLPGVLAEFSMQYPGVALFVRELALPELLEAVRRQDVDFGVGPRPDERLHEFAFEPFMQDAICVLMPAAGAKSYRRGIGLAALSRMPILLISRQSGLRAMLDAALQRSGLALQIRCEALYIQTLVEMAKAGMGVAVLPRIAVPEALGEDLRIVPVTDPPLLRDLGVITRRGQAHSPAAQRLRQGVCEAMTRPQRRAGGPASQRAS
ncbi:LysR substrate-binding domain-containing protein [Orrella sp. JC864]|uniref:LysR family transcriptional regulator n=1 Tax=Orrella sp. JC864 TaxID=3120298 RepID=UPI0012BD15C9